MASSDFLRITEYRKVNGTLVPVYIAGAADNITVESWGTPAADTPLSTVLSDMQTQIDNLSAIDALIPKGAVPSTGLPANHTVGWTYWVTSDFAGTTVNGVVTEVGDMIVCINSGTTAADADWLVVQTNLDPTEFVKGPSSTVTTDTVAVFDGTTGKIIKSSGFTLGKSVPSSAVFTDVNVTQTKSTASGEYRVLLKNSANDTNQTASALYASGVTVNPSTGTLTATTFKGNLDGGFSSAVSIALTGDVTGSASGTNSWSIATTLAASGATAGAYGPSAGAILSHGDTFDVPYVTVNAKGIVTAVSTKTFTLPASGDTHWTANLYTASAATGKANAAVSNPFLNLVENNTVRNSHQIIGAGTVTVASDANGNITITGLNTNVDTKVTQTSTTSNTTYNVLFTHTANATGDVTEGVRYDTDFKYNPSTNLITGVTVSGHVTAVASDTDDNKLLVTKAGSSTAENVSLPVWVSYGTALPSSAVQATLPDGAIFFLVPAGS